MTTPTLHGAPELLPCPFCGSTNLHVFIDTEDGNESHGIQCAGCWMSSSEKGSKDEAAEAWNRRAAIQQAAGAVAEGWKLVPLELDEKVRDVLIDRFERSGRGACLLFTDVWADLLSAAPHPPAAQQPEKIQGDLAACAGGGVTQPLLTGDQWHAVNCGADAIEKMVKAGDWNSDSVYPEISTLRAMLAGGAK